MRTFWIAGALVTLASPAVQAQIERLPATGRAEAQSGALNQGLVTQERNRAAGQQNQFEVNSLRNELSRSPAPVIVAPPIVIGR